MIYGDLTLRDRLLRGLIGAVLGGLGGFLIILRAVMRGRESHPVMLLIGTLVGAAIGGLLAFRRTKIGW